jgi:hypothetical protein
VLVRDLDSSSRGTLRHVFGEITDLVEGGHRIEQVKERYVVRRPDESTARYNNRLSKFVYTNLIGDLIRDYAARLAKGKVVVEGDLDSRWARVIPNLDGRGSSVLELAKIIVEDLMQFGESWYHIDRGVTSGETALEDLQRGSLPYGVRLDPASICDYEEGTQGLEWVRWKTTAEKRSPFGGGQTTIENRWFVATREGVQVWASRNRDTSAYLETEVYHGLGVVPVAYLREPSLWVASQARLKAVQHLNIENGLTDTATIAGYIQRIFTPSRAVTENADTLVDEDYAASLRDLKTSNNHLLIGERFDFAEAQGRSIQSVSALLDKIERQIRDIVSLGGVYESQGTVQSGRSKEVEYQLSNEQLLRFGQSVKRQLGQVLTLLEARLGIAPLVSVSGLDRYDDGVSGESLVEALDNEGLLGTTAYALLRRRYVAGLIGEVDPATWAAIEDELT